MTSVLNKYFFLLLISFLIFIGRWILSFYYFDENLTLRIILEAVGDGYFYFPYVKFLSLFDLSLSFDLEESELKNISIPFYGILLHSLLFKLIGASSFILLEFLFIYLFVILFFLIFSKFNLSTLSSIIFTLIFFQLSYIIEATNLNSIPYFSVIVDFYNLRFQRPLVVIPFLLLFILFVINLREKDYEYKNFVLLGFLLALSFTSHYYFFIIEVLALIIFILQKERFNFVQLLKRYKFFFISIISFLFFSLPFLINLIYVEPDYSERLCLFELTFERKTILLGHLISKILEIKFLLLFLTITIINFFLNFKKLKKVELSNIFYVLFVSSVLSPFVFIAFSPTSCHVYHFTNAVVVFAFLTIFFQLIVMYKNFITFINLGKFFKVFLVFLLILSFNALMAQNFYNKYKNQAYLEERLHLNNVVNLIKEIRSEDLNLSLLTLDERLMIWGILSDIKDIKLISGQIVPKTHNMIEEDLISVFKFFDKNSSDFIKFFKNKKTSWRFYNEHTQLFFWMRYSANSLTTHMNSKNFDKSSLEFISKISPLHNQSLAIPNEEFVRLKKKYQETKFEEISPSIISINHKDFVIDDYYLLNKDYCLINAQNKYKIYVLNRYKKACNIK